jgi:hypothetical protein
MGLKKVIKRWSKVVWLMCYLDFAIDTSGLYYTIDPLAKTSRQCVLP